MTVHTARKRRPALRWTRRGCPALVTAGLSILLLLAGCSEPSTDSPVATSRVDILGQEPVVQLGFDDGGEVQFVTGRHTENAISSHQLHGLVGMSLPQAMDKMIIQMSARGYAIDDLDINGNSLVLELERSDGETDDGWQEFQQRMDGLYRRLSLPAVTHTLPPLETVRPEAAISRREARSIADSWIGVEGTAHVYREQKLEYHNGILYYDLEVLAGDRVYELQIDARSGEMLGFYEQPLAAAAVRRDDDGAYALDNPTDGVAPSFSLAEARALAAAWTGYKEAELDFAEEGLKYRRGVLFYELEVIAGERKYVFQIDAFDGEVLQFVESSAPRRATDSAR